MNKLSLKTKNKQDLEAKLQLLGQGIGPVRINEKGEIFVFDEKKTKKEYKIGQARRRIISGEEIEKLLEKTDKQEKEDKNNI